MEFNNDEENSQTLTLSKLQDKINLKFDYEVNSIKLDEKFNMKCKLYCYNPKNIMTKISKIISQKKKNIKY